MDFVIQCSRYTVGTQLTLLTGCFEKVRGKLMEKNGVDNICFVDETAALSFSLCGGCPSLARLRVVWWSGDPCGGSGPGSTPVDARPTDTE